MNTVFDYLINNRVLTTFNAINKELALQPQKNYLFDLSYFGVINVLGEKSIDFLQGQLTCDMRSLSDKQMIQGAQCNLKGRLLTLMDVITWQGVKLILPKDLISTTINSLCKTAMLSRVSLEINRTVNVLGLYLQNPEDHVPLPSLFSKDLYGQTDCDHSCYYYLGHGFYICLIQSELADDLKKGFMDKNQFLGSLTWHTLRLALRQIDIYPESRGLFLPHRLDLQKTHYISFNKGCYKGQEIIARMHYKATIKHHMQVYAIKTNQKIYSGQKLFSPEGIELGEVVDFSILDYGYYLIAVSILKGSEPRVLFDKHSEPLELLESELYLKGRELN